jgi:hypothetical protein
MTGVKEHQQLALGDRLYEQYARPFEAEHWGEFVAIAEDGRTLLGADLLEVAQRAKEYLGQGTYLFKVGERAVGKWRFGRGEEYAR